MHRHLGVQGDTIETVVPQAVYGAPVGPGSNRTILRFNGWSSTRRTSASRPGRSLAFHPGRLYHYRPGPAPPHLQKASGGRLARKRARQGDDNAALIRRFDPPVGL